MNRRLFLKGAGAAGIATFLVPQLASASIGDWPKSLMESTSYDEVKKQLAPNPTEGEIRIKAPQIAENGATVPIEIDAKSVQGNVETITILISSNPRPIAASFNLKKGAVPIVGTRIKMGKSGTLTALVKTDKGTFYTDTEIKVTIGGCGG